MIVHIRPYQLGDAPGLLALVKDTIRRVNCRDYSPAQIAAWASDEIDLEIWTKRFATRPVFVAEVLDQGKMALGGFADLEADGHLDRFFVSADYQRCGIGRRLLAEIVRLAAQTSISRIFTEASITARPFFLSQGFREITPQTISWRGVEFVNYRMELLLERK
jgi:putative acetyltransferase